MDSDSLRSTREVARRSAQLADSLRSTLSRSRSNRPSLHYTVLPFVRGKKQISACASIAPLRFATTGVFSALCGLSGFGGFGRLPAFAVCAVASLGFRGFFWRFFCLRVFMALVGFCGSRFLSGRFAPLVSCVVGSVLRSGRSVAVGCASGADRFVRSAAPSASVFRASSFGSGRGSIAARSAALVSAVAASGSGCGLVVFVSSPCPVRLFPSAFCRA